MSNITDEIYANYLQMNALGQQTFLQELDNDELIDMEARLTGQDRASVATGYQSRTQYPPATTGTGGMSMYDFPMEGSAAAATVKEIMSGMKDDRFEYTGLKNKSFRRKLGFMDTGEEKENFMTKTLGAGKGEGWVMDKYGRYAIMPEYREALGATPGDKPLIIDNPDGFEREDISDLAGSAPEIVSAIAASIATRNYGTGAAMMASGAATGSAKALEEGFETGLDLLGFPASQEQSLGEVGKDVAFEAAIGAGGEAGGRLLLGTGKYLFSPGEVRVPTGNTGVFNFKTYTYQPKVDAASGPGQRQTYDLVRELLDEGAIPDVYKATNRKVLGRTAGLIEEVLGYNTLKNTKNVKYMSDRINGFLSDEGLETFEPFMNNVFPKLNEEQLGALIQAKRNAAATVTEESANSALQILKNAIKEESTKTADVSGKAPSEVGEVVVKNVTDAFDNFRATTNTLYDEADQLLKGRAIIPTQPIKKVAADLLEGLPKTADGKVSAGFNDDTVKMLQDILNTTDYISAGQMARYRTLFSQSAFDPDMLKGFDIVKFNLLKEGANEAFDVALNNGVKGFRYVDASGNTVLGTKKITDPKELENINTGLELLKNAKKTYAEGIDLFDNRLVKSLTKKDGVDPGLIIQTIVTRNSPKRIKDVINATDDPEATRKMLQAGHYDSMLVNATDVDGNFSVSRVLSQIKQMGTSYPALYGDSAPIIKSSLEQLSSAIKYVPKEDMIRITKSLTSALDEGKPGMFTKEVKAYVDATNKRFDFLDNNFNKAIEKYSPEEVVPWLINRAKTTDIVDFMNYYGKESDEFIGFKQTYMQNVLDSMFVTQKESPVAAFLNGENLVKFLKKEGQVSKLNAVFGAETTQAIEKFAQKASFLTSKAGQEGGGFAAANIGLHPLDNLGKLAQLKILGGVLSNPKTLKYLTTIIENPSKRAVGFAVTNLGTDVITLMENEVAIRPEHKKEMLLKLSNGVYNYMNTEEENE